MFKYTTEHIHIAIAYKMRSTNFLFLNVLCCCVIPSFSHYDNVIVIDLVTRGKLKSIIDATFFIVIEKIARNCSKLFIDLSFVSRH